MRNYTSAVVDPMDEAMDKLEEARAHLVNAAAPMADAISNVATSVPDAAVADIMGDPVKLAQLMNAMKEQDKADKKVKRQAADDARRERRGLPRRGEATAQQQEALEEIIDKADPELILTFLMMNMPATLIRCIESMEKAEFPWHQEVS